VEKRREECVLWAIRKSNARGQSALLGLDAFGLRKRIVISLPSNAACLKVCHEQFDIDRNAHNMVLVSGWASCGRFTWSCPGTNSTAYPYSKPFH